MMKDVVRRVVKVSVVTGLILVALFLIYVAIFLLQNRSEVKRAEDAFATRIKSPEQYDLIPRRTPEEEKSGQEDYPTGLELCGRAIKVTESRRYHDMFYATVTFELIVIRQRCDTRETWLVRRGAGHISTSIVTGSESGPKR